MRSWWWLGGIKNWIMAKQMVIDDLLKTSRDRGIDVYVELCGQIIGEAKKGKEGFYTVVSMFLYQSFILDILQDEYPDIIYGYCAAICHNQVDPLWINHHTGDYRTHYRSKKDFQDNVIKDLLNNPFFSVVARGIEQYNRSTGT